MGRKKRRKLRATSELIRVFLTPSGLADSLAGYTIGLASAGRAFDGPRLAYILLASASLYAFGMATNDIFDIAKDRKTSPGKPLPSGRLALSEAIGIAAALGVAALIFGWLAQALLPAVAIIVLAIGYNAGGKRVALLGNLLMGSCRGLNFVMGVVSAAGDNDALRAAPALIAAAILVVFVAGVTSISRLEDRAYKASSLHVRATPLLVIPLLLGVLEPFSTGNWINCTLLLWLLIAVHRSAASRHSSAHPAAVYVRGALAGIALVDVGLIWAFVPTGEAPLASVVALYALAVLGWWWKRLWLQSGGLDT